ncbi:sensor histidine kinase [Hymenobacter cheonanensis]|uniref:sensor histidine kinase n=1 Tax=Hymenobacter sp. CA2-7 TaxID=3063993 RepID=UPI0027127B8A|nr:sensor histidine kinase [Hymenobacter sp. CA2-7]MDO7886854.1 ATP-binding protein [Hymenobacter sp. CA2-7]
MQLQAKITLGFLAMLGLLLGIGCYGYATLGRLDRANRAVLQENFYSVQLGQGMLQALDGLAARPANGPALARLHTLLDREADNVTEPGERRLVDSLTQTLAGYPGTDPAAGQARLRQLTHRVVALNMTALTRKNGRAMHAAAQAKSYLLLFSVLSALVGLMLVGSVPQAAVGGLRKLAASLDYATRTNFAVTVPIESTDEVGQVTAAFNRLLVHVQDIRSHSLADVVTERNRTSGLVHTLSEPLFLLDPGRRVLVANPAACALLGLAESQVLARPAAELAQENPVFAQLLAPALLPVAQRPAGPQPLAVVGPDGAPAHYQLWVHEAVAFNEARDQMEAVGTVLALRNVSAFRQLDQTKSDFLATVSHELKTPLSSINFNLKLLHDPRVGSLNAEQQELVATMKQENQRLLRLVGELLTVARLDVGQGIALDPRPLAVPDLVAAATSPLRLQLRARHLTLDTELPANLPPIRADHEKTTWVLLNLLVNAVRYSPEQGHILLSAAPTPDRRAVRVQVQDHGPGIALADQQRIFERFAQGPAAPEASPHDDHGTGLGLSISREFIASQGGELGVESTAGQGSTFYFTLPVA